MADNKVNGQKAAVERSYLTCISGMFEAMDDNAYMQERAATSKDVAKNVFLAHLLQCDVANPSMINEEVVIVAHRFDNQSDTETIRPQLV